MIIDCVSDLHGYLPELEGGDLLILAGDYTANDRMDGWRKFFDWLERQKYDKKILIAGNHDNFCQSWATSNDSIHEVLGKPSFCYLCDSGEQWRGLKIWGSPWTSQFPGINPKCCAFTRPFMETLKDRWELIPSDVDILITHTPPHRILDKVKTDYEANVGDVDLLVELNERIKPKLHVFGHIHENGGKELIFKRPGIATENNTICVNASYVNERYKPVNKPIRIIL